MIETEHLESDAIRRILEILHELFDVHREGRRYLTSRALLDAVELRFRSTRSRWKQS